jgi:hypothetical protein
LTLAARTRRFRQKAATRINAAQAEAQPMMAPLF